MKLTTHILALSLFSLSTTVFAEEARYASITHTNVNYLNQGYCSYSFILDNGGNHMVSDNSGFGPLELTFRMIDKQGKSIRNEVLKVEEFGDIGATRSISSYLETECADVGGFQLVKAIEDQNGKKVELSLGLFEPMNPELAKISVAGN
nr:IrmA family protein [uncultured Moellerella sp.]